MLYRWCTNDFLKTKCFNGINRQKLQVGTHKIIGPFEVTAKTNNA